MSLYTRRLTIVVDAPRVATANARAAEVDTGGAGDRTFTVGLSASGSPPPTHYWCGWQMRTADDASIREKLAAAIAAGQVRVFNGATTTPEEVLTTVGLQPVGAR